MIMEKRPILVQVAMEVECRKLLDKVVHVKEVMDSGYLFYEFEIDGYPVVLSLSKVGLIEAASSLSIAIRKYRPKVIINYGIAGATTNKLHVSDMVIGTSCMNINSYRTSFLEKGMGSCPEKWEFLTFLSGEEDRFVSYSSSLELVDLAIDNPPLTKYLCGRIGSGDVWNREIDRILFLNREYGVLCEDMECVSTYQIAEDRNIPVISFKMISDNILLGEEYNREVGIYLQEYIYLYVSKLIEKMCEDN